MFDPITVCRQNRHAIQLKYKLKDECAICYEPMYNKCVKYLACEHVFHLKCVNKWLNKSHTCPVCRENTRTSTNTDEDDNFSRMLQEILDEISTNHTQLNLDNHPSFPYLNVDYYDPLNTYDLD